MTFTSNKPDTRRIEVRIVADTRNLRRQFIRAQLVIERRWWRRLRLRFALWRVNREPAP